MKSFLEFIIGVCIGMLIFIFISAYILCMVHIYHVLTNTLK